MAQFNKLCRLTDLLPQDPDEAIRGVWDRIGPGEIIAQLRIWLLRAVSNENSVDTNPSQRSSLVIFYTHLLNLITAFHTKTAKAEKPAYRTDPMEDVVSRDPMKEIKSFCTRFSLQYAEIELWDFFNAAVCYEGQLTEQFNKIHAFDLYPCLQCLVESAYALVNRE